MLKKYDVILKSSVGKTTEYRNVSKKYIEKLLTFINTRDVKWEIKEWDFNGNKFSKSFS